MRYLDQPWPLRAATLALLVFAFFGIYRPGEDEQQSLRAATADTLVRTQTARDALAHSGVYIASAQAIRHELGDVRLVGDEHTSISSMLIDFDRRAKYRGVQFVGLEPQRAQPGALGVEYIIHARGHYGDLLHFCDDLALTQDLLELQAIDFARDAKSVRVGSPPVLDAALHVVLLHFATATGPAPGAAAGSLAAPGNASAIGTAAVAASKQEPIMPSSSQGQRNS